MDNKRKKTAVIAAIAIPVLLISLITVYLAGDAKDSSVRTTAEVTTEEAPAPEATTEPKAAADAVPEVKATAEATTEAVTAVITTTEEELLPEATTEYEAASAPAVEQRPAPEATTEAVTTAPETTEEAPAPEAKKPAKKPSKKPEKDEEPATEATTEAATEHTHVWKKYEVEPAWDEEICNYHSICNVCGAYLEKLDEDHLLAHMDACCSGYTDKAVVDEVIHHEAIYGYKCKCGAVK